MCEQIGLLRGKKDLCQKEKAHWFFGGTDLSHPKKSNTKEISASNKGGRETRKWKTHSGN